MKHKDNTQKEKQNMNSAEGFHLDTPASLSNKEIDLDENKILFEWMNNTYGKRCPDYEAGCPCCEAWVLYDLLIQKKDLIEEEHKYKRLLKGLQKAYDLAMLENNKLRKKLRYK